MTDLTLRAGEAPSPTTPEVRPVAGDLLQGADAIAGFLGLTRRQTYHAVNTGRLPVFRMGGTQIFARKSTLLAWIKDQEERSGGTPPWARP